MRLLISCFLAAALCASAQTFARSANAQGWETVLRSLGLVSTDPVAARVYVQGREAALPDTFPLARVESGALLILEGHSQLALTLGIAAEQTQIEVRQLRDVASPDLPIVWKLAETLPSPKLSKDWTVRAKERWTNAPLLAIRSYGKGAILWTATTIGESGYERYPFLPQALLAAGLDAKVRAQGLWAFFDAGFRQRVDLEFLVSQWKSAGIGGIHVTSWQFDGASPDRAAWLHKLIALCHKSLIHVYAWVELPHVSERFWQQHPACRERTATGMEASLDWRRLINLVDTKCSQQVEHSLLELLRAYDWDGVNLGELYFESLEGHDNPARFTPFHDAVRAEYKLLHGRDPLEDLKGEGLPRLLQYRADLAARLQADWLSKLETLRRDKPNLDIILTHIDDRFDTNMRNALGADAARVLRGTEGMGTGFLIEDPATVWHLGPARYREIRKRYQDLTSEPERLSIDLNIVDRYQDVYPTRRQTGAELAQLIHEASASFDQVALYFEYSLRPVDLPLLGPAAARLEAWHESATWTDIKLTAPARVRWKGNAKVNGILWPLTDGESILLPAGAWHVEATQTQPPMRVTDLNVRIEAVVKEESGIRIQYTSRAQGTALIESLSGLERHTLRRGKGSFNLNAKPPEAAVESSSAPLLLHR
jgi:hypothetical protein